MTPRMLSARERQRFDALIDRPLRAFRAQIVGMNDSDLGGLRKRLEARLVGAQFSRGAHGLARHLAGQELPLLERRLALVIAQQARPHVRQLRLVESDVSAESTVASVISFHDMEEQAA